MQNIHLVIPKFITDGCRKGQNTSLCYLKNSWFMYILCNLLTYIEQFSWEERLQKYKSSSILQAKEALLLSACIKYCNINLIFVTICTCSHAVSIQYNALWITEKYPKFTISNTRPWLFSFVNEEFIEKLFLN